MQLEFNINEQTLTYESKDKKPVAKSKNYLYAHFTFSDEWEGKNKTAIFTSASGYVVSVQFENDTCEVPPEVIDFPHFSVSVFGGDRITTNRVSVPITKDGLENGAPPAPKTPDVYEVILNKVTETEQIATEIAEGEAQRAADFAKMQADFEAMFGEAEQLNDALESVVLGGAE